MYMRAALLALALGQASALLSSPPSDDKHASALTSPPNDEEANYDKFAVLRAPPNEDKVAVLRALDDAQVMAEVARRNLNACDDAPPQDQEHRALTEVFYSFNYQCECDPTPAPTLCPKKLDVCIAVDESGSICSKKSGEPRLCKDGDCDSTTCTDTVPPSDFCNYDENCPKFNTDTKTFVTDFINLLSTDPAVDELRVSIVSYETDADEVTSGLTDATTATTAVNGIVYSGGFTNLEQAILKCKDTLKDSEAAAIVTIGDGNPNRKGKPATAGDARTAAATAATAAKADGIDIATVFIETVYDPIPDEDFLENEIASEGLGFTPPVFATDQALATALAEKAKCSSGERTTSTTTTMATPAPTTPEPSPAPTTPEPSSKPTLSPTVCDYKDYKQYKMFKGKKKTSYDHCKNFCKNKGMQMPCIPDKDVDDALGLAMGVYPYEAGVETSWFAIKKWKGKWYWEDHCDIHGYTKFKQTEWHPNRYECRWGKCDDQYLNWYPSNPDEDDWTGPHARKSKEFSQASKKGKWFDIDGNCDYYACVCQPKCH